MQGHDQKEQDTAKLNRRKFLVRAGLGSLPILASLKSKGAWGFDTLNCSLSQTGSMANSVSPEDFQRCASKMDSHGSAKRYFEPCTEGTTGGKGAFFYKYDSNSGSSDSSKGKGKGKGGDEPSCSGVNVPRFYAGVVEINQHTLFNTIFGSGYHSTLEDAVDVGPDSLTRNIAAVFLHALYYELTNQSSNLPSPAQVVNAYINAVSTLDRQKLSALLEYYIDGTPYPWS
jgi:hypothetical protein